MKTYAKVLSKNDYKTLKDCRTSTTVDQVIAKFCEEPSKKKVDKNKKLLGIHRFNKRTGRAVSTGFGLVNPIKMNINPETLKTLKK